MRLDSATRLVDQAKSALAYARLEGPKEQERRERVLTAVAQRGGKVSGEEFRAIKLEAGYKSRGGGGLSLGHRALFGHDHAANTWGLTPHRRAVLANERRDLSG